MCVHQKENTGNSKRIKSESNPNERIQSKMLSGEGCVSCFLFSTIFKQIGFHVRSSKINKITTKTFLIAKSISGENKTI